MNDLAVNDNDAIFETWLKQSNDNLIASAAQGIDIEEMLIQIKRKAVGSTKTAHSKTQERPWRDDGNAGQGLALTPKEGVDTMDEPIQLCGTCKQYKPLEDYSPSKRGQAGSQCKSCNNAARRKDKSGVSAPPHEPLLCTYCGEWYVPKQLKKNAKYCSRQCWLNERAAEAEARRLTKACCPDGSCYLHHETQRCGHCKQPKPLSEYIPSHRGTTGHWCKPCHAAYARGEQQPSALHEPQQCVQCEKWYIPTNLYEQRDRPSKHCSEACNQAAKEDRRRARLRASKGERACQYCGELIPKEAVRNKLFCSRECCKKADRLQRRLKQRVRMEVPTTSSLFLDICIRDNWTCQLCYEPVDMTVRHPDPMCPSLDHVIQVHWGGTNDPNNLRLTHLGCNQRRPRKRIDPAILWSVPDFIDASLGR